MLGEGADIENRTRADHALLVLHANARPAAHHVVDLVLVMGGLEILRPGGECVDSATQAGNLQKLVIGLPGLLSRFEQGSGFEGLPGGVGVAHDG